MNSLSCLQDMNFSRAQRILHSLITRVTVLALSLIAVGCNLHNFEQTSRYAETKLVLDSANFETEVAHAEGEASCFYILLSIPLCKNQNIATIAWNRMRDQAQMEGKSAQFVNVFEDHSVRWNFLSIFYLEYYSVSANVIVYKQPEQQSEKSVRHLALDKNLTSINTLINTK